jgi:hypothetical protein
VAGKVDQPIKRDLDPVVGVRTQMLGDSQPRGSHARDACLNVHCFSSVADTKGKIAAWMKHDNESRPHRALNNLRPWSMWLNWKMEPDY